MGLYGDENKCDKCFDEFVGMHVASANAKVMLVCLYRGGGRTREMYETHESYMFTDIHESKSTTRGNRT